MLTFAGFVFKSDSTDSIECENNSGRLKTFKFVNLKVGNKISNWAKESTNLISKKTTNLKPIPTINQNNS